jgi:signal transduction histidine kinase/ActR/RegA family two-component response regulator
MNNRILFLLAQKENRNLLSEWLGKIYHILPFDAGLDQDFDLCIIDLPAIEKLWEEVQSKKISKKPIFLPFLLISSSYDVKMLTKHLWKTVDDFILCPIEKLGLKASIKILLMARNLSMEKIMVEEELRQSKESALSDSHAKSKFLVNMSHKIKTSMNEVVSILEMIVNTELTEEQKKLLYIAKNSSETLLNIINDILDLSKIEAEKLNLHNVIFDLRKTLEEIISLHALKAEEKGLVFSCLIHRNIPSLLKGDPVKLSQVLVNLINNAINFTEKGEIMVRITLEEETETHVTVHFSVMDTGTGIEEEKKHLIFTPFFQMDSSITQNYGRNGMGLVTVKKVVEMMGGHTGVESVKGKGSTFWFTAILEREFKGVKDEITGEYEAHVKDYSESDKYELPDMAKETPGRNLRILIAEDNITSQYVTQILLEKIHCQADLVSNGKEVLSSIETVPYDLILMDLQMPELDGLETTRIIRKKEKDTGKHIPIIAMTAYAMQEDREHCIEAGMDDYITKPIQRDELFKSIKNLQCFSGVVEK